MQLGMLDSSRRTIAGVILAVAALVLSTFAVSTPEAQAAPEDDWVETTLASMTLEEKVGQLFMTHAYGTTADTQDPADVAANQELYGVDNAQELIDKYQVGGIIYFAWTNSVQNPDQIARLSNGIQDAALAQPSGVPSLVGIDQEGGIVARIGPPATQLPGNMALGAGRSASDAQTAAAINGDELSAMGINWNFAPVADVNVNPANPVIGVRSFSENPRLAATMTAAQTRGYTSAGVAGAAKHFPGHGDTATDSHTGLPVIDHTREEWEQLDRPPFQAAIDAGVPAIMSAHISVPALDPSGDPATLSEPIMTGILREELGYDGVVITDALDMAGASATYGNDRVPVLALKAGVDMLLMPPEFDVAYNAVLDAVESGELTEERIDTSVRRILTLKHDLGITDDPHVDPAQVPAHVGTPDHLATLQSITDRTTTLVRNHRDLLPLPAASPGRDDVLVTGWGVSTTQTVADKLVERGYDTTVVETGTNPDEATTRDVARQAKQHDLVVVTTNRAGLETQQGQAHLVNRLKRTRTPVVAVGVRDAYDVNQFKKVDAYLATYSYTAAALDSLVRVLVGELDPTGRLPVTIPRKNSQRALYPYGHGLEY
ncbi:glycoside hydrolase family 3 protein [Nocardioides sp. GXQ0305]|uniref:glycoside hydrolase family 3 protein n=1 Tax=Nocardioides sp. GXQ0305 TaxID=3423912 RepID=UPI003D7D7CAA